MATSQLSQVIQHLREVLLRDGVPQTHTDGGRGFNWGWLGLVGLIGLAGLVRGNGRSHDRNMGSTINPNRP